jgi:hypothetical protein
MDRRLGGPQRRYGCGGEKIIPLLPPLRRELNPSNPPRSVVSILSYRGCRCNALPHRNALPKCTYINTEAVAIIRKLR